MLPTELFSVLYFLLRFNLNKGLCTLKSLTGDFPGGPVIKTSLS